MFTRLIMLLVGLAFSFAALAAGEQYLLGVKGLACPFCSFGIEKRLNKVDGVTEVQVNIADGVVLVTMEEGESLTEQQARQAVSEAGFTLGDFSRAEAVEGEKK